MKKYLLCHRLEMAIEESDKLFKDVPLGQSAQVSQSPLIIHVRYHA